MLYFQPKFSQHSHIFSHLILGSKSFYGRFYFLTMNETLKYGILKIIIVIRISQRTEKKK